MLRHVTGDLLIGRPAALCAVDAGSSGFGFRFHASGFAGAGDALTLIEFHGFLHLRRSSSAASCSELERSRRARHKSRRDVCTIGRPESLPRRESSLT